MNFTFLANPVFSESGSGMAVAGSVVGSCTGGLVAASVIAVLFGGVAVAGWYLAYRYRAVNQQLRANQASIDLVRRYQRTPSSLERMLNDFEEPVSVYGPTPRGGIRLPNVPLSRPKVARPRMATPATSITTY